MSGKLLLAALLAFSAAAGCHAFPGSGSLEAVLKSQVHPVVEELARNAIHSRIESLLTADQGKNSDTIEEMVATLEKNFHRQKAFGLEVDNDFEEAKESDGQSGYWVIIPHPDDIDVSESIHEHSTTEPEMSTITLS